MARSKRCAASRCPCSRQHRHRHRRQRRRQDHAAQCGNGDFAGSRPLRLRRRRPWMLMPFEERVALGLALVPEKRELFGSMSVEDNLLLGGFRTPRGRPNRSMAEVFSRFPRLEERRRQLAGTLSGGERQMLAMGRALMGAAAPAHAGRAKPRSCAPDRARHLRDHHGFEEDRGVDPAGRAECTGGTTSCRPCLRHGVGGTDRRRTSRDACRRSTYHRKLPRPRRRSLVNYVFLGGVWPMRWMSSDVSWRNWSPVCPGYLAQ